MNASISNHFFYIHEYRNIYYFCQAPREDYFQRAKPYKDHPTTARYPLFHIGAPLILRLWFFVLSSTREMSSGDVSVI